MAGKRIVVIDDDLDMHQALKLILEPVGYEVIGCLTGPEGMEAIRRHRPDLIMLDVMLASPSEGFHIAYELRQDEVLKEIPVIMISAIGQTWGMDYAKEIGSEYLPVERFLEKPLSADTVRRVVAETLAEQQPHGSG